MEFGLLFEGEIRPRQRAKLADIHSIRQQLHPQLKELWDHPPLVHVRDWLRLPTKRHPHYALLEQRGTKIYAPLITKRGHLLGELDIILLRQQPPGQLISEGGDIDNRLKTLFDALRVPSLSEIQGLGTATVDDEEPFHCLFQDDSLITSVNVETDRLLRPARREHELVSIIKVRKGDPRHGQLTRLKSATEIVDQRIPCGSRRCRFPSWATPPFFQQDEDRERTARPSVGRGYLRVPGRHAQTFARALTQQAPCRTRVPRS
jgi:hypothetical protein